MKLKSLKPLYLGGLVRVEGNLFETIEQHGRELVTRGYAEEVSEGDPSVTISEEEAAGAGVLASDSVSMPVDGGKPKKPTTKSKAE